MNIVKKIIGKIKSIFNNCCEAIENYILQKKRISIISNNCIAGYIYKYFGMKFLSPTINLQIAPSDFIKFCSALSIYTGWGI